MKPHNHAHEHHHVDLRTLTDEEKFELEIFHDYDDEANGQKLKKFYGRVAEWQDAFILKHIEGPSVVDIGAGYGNTTRLIQKAGFDVTGIDPNPRAREYAKKWYGIDLQDVDIHYSTFADKSFDTALIREALEHLDFEKTLAELKRVVRKDVIIFQNNLTWILLAARWILGHHEFNAQPLEYYVAQLKKANFKIKSIEFHDTIAFPLSGGLLTKQFLPSHTGLENFVLRFDDKLTRFLNRIKLSRYVCWRYLIHATVE